MSWHPFELGQVYPLAEVLVTCERRLNDAPGAMLSQRGTAATEKYSKDVAPGVE
jgi:hypothetical protein